jgi:asparagine synthase (glutamine-hydrolysing)
MPASARGLLAGDKLHKSAGVLASRSIAEVYRGLVSHWPDPSRGGDRRSSLRLS